LVYCVKKNLATVFACMLLYPRKIELTAKATFQSKKKMCAMPGSVKSPVKIPLGKLARFTAAETCRRLPRHGPAYRVSYRKTREKPQESVGGN
jgi:hypothetical protein